MDLRYWKCPNGHISVQNLGYRSCYCTECKKEYDWKEGTEIEVPDDGISDKPYPYD